MAKLPMKLNKRHRNQEKKNAVGPRCTFLHWWRLLGSVQDERMHPASSPGSADFIGMFGGRIQRRGSLESPFIWSKWQTLFRQSSLSAAFEEILRRWSDKRPPECCLQHLPWWFHFVPGFWLFFLPRMATICADKGAKWQFANVNFRS